jgi:hypothetical protein
MDVALVTAPNSSHISRVRAALSLVNGCQRFYRLSLVLDDVGASRAAVNAADVCAKWQAAGRSGPWSVIITDAPLDDNWFSHEYRECAIITIGDWEQLYAPPSLRSYLIYQIAQALIHFAADMSEEMALNMVHEPAVGCIYDMVVHKPDIKYGMVAGNICPACVARLRALGTRQEAIDALASILEIVRSEALGMPVSLDPEEAFVVMRFSSNDENDNAWKYGIKLGAERCGLRVSRADNSVESGQILDKVQRCIARSRLVIAKVDQDNLNVYFELGLAMGMKKDVLLVSDDSLVLSLPSDLRNWECLVYKRGDYEQLARRVSEFLKSAYGLAGLPGAI